MIPDRKKVQHGLECCYNNNCGACPYSAIKKCLHKLHSDALALLNEREARVLTLEEIKSLPDETDVWLEEIECIVVAVTISKQGEKWGIVKESLTFFYGIEGNSYNDGGDYEDADYGKYWRCWTSRPTPEQMRDTKWEGEKE